MKMKSRSTSGLLGHPKNLTYVGGMKSRPAIRSLITNWNFQLATSKTISLSAWPNTLKDSGKAKTSSIVFSPQRMRLAFLALDRLAIWKLLATKYCSSMFPNFSMLLIFEDGHYQSWRVSVRYIRSTYSNLERAWHGFGTMTTKRIDDWQKKVFVRRETYLTLASESRPMSSWELWMCVEESPASRWLWQDTFSRNTWVSDAAFF